MKWTGNITVMRDMRNTYKILVGKLEGNRLHDLGVGGRIINLSE
jgi:hypothetical protein